MATNNSCYDANTELDAIQLAEQVKLNLEGDTLVFTEQIFIDKNAGKLTKNKGKTDEKQLDPDQALRLLVFSGHVRQNRNGDEFNYNFTQVLSKRIRNLREAVTTAKLFIDEFNHRMAKPDIDAETLAKFAEQKTINKVGYDLLNGALQFLIAKAR